VASVAPYGPAAEAGLRPGDVLLSIQGQAIESVTDATERLSAAGPNQIVRMIIWREGQEVLVRLRRR
jgi:serine protease Do